MILEHLPTTGQFAHLKFLGGMRCTSLETIPPGHRRSSLAYASLLWPILTAGISSFPILSLPFLLIMESSSNRIIETQRRDTASNSSLPVLWYRMTPRLSLPRPVSKCVAVVGLRFQRETSKLPSFSSIGMALMGASPVSSLFRRTVIQ